MIWNKILITFSFMILGYLIGSVLSSVLIIKLFKLEDIRKKGSKNPGATNAVRIHGALIGFIVFFLDFSKPIIAVLISNFIVDYDKIIIQFVALAAVIGHIFPIFHKFKGGKGAACMFGTILIMNWTLFFIAITIFFIVIIIFKISALGSLISAPITLISYITLSQIDGYNSKIFEPITFEYSYWLNVLTLALIILFIIWSHRQNIKKLISKEKYNYNF